MSGKPRPIRTKFGTHAQVKGGQRLAHCVLAYRMHVERESAFHCIYILLE